MQYQGTQEQRQPLVLVIVDNPAQKHLYELAKDEIEVIPCVLSIVSSCEEAMEAAERLDFDLIIMDFRLPSDSGLECTKKLKELDLERGTKIPKLAVTAHAMPGDREKCLEAGADDYLSKPFALGDLKKKILVLSGTLCT